MQITQEKLGDLKALVKIQIEKNDYQTKVEKSIKDYSRKVTLKGFRPGKVPSAIVKKMYGNQILFDELNRMLSEELNNYIKENEIDILGNPLPQRNESLVIDVLEPKDYEFEYELGLAPDFELSFLKKKPSFEQFKIVPDKKELDEEIEKLQKRFGTSTNPDDIEEEDIVYVQLTETDENGEPIDDGVTNSPAIPVNMISDEKVKKQFMKLKKDDEMMVDIFKFMDRDKSEIARFVLGIDEDKVDQVGKNFRLKVENITRIQPAPVDRELFDKVYGEGKVENEEEFRNKISEELENYYQSQSERKLIADIVEKLMEKTEIPLPDTFLKKWIQETNDKEISDDEIEKDYPAFAKNLKWSLIVNKIAEQNQIKIEAEELKERMRQNVRNQLMQYGYMDFPDDQMDAYVQNLLKDQEQVRQTRDLILEDKIFDHIKSEISLKEKEISVEKFNKLISKEK
ncbi:MAG: trigger factor [Chitinophagales bacterium]|nr:trigger factor [Chitinophagales bacterium]